MTNQLEVKQVPFMGTNLMAAKDADGQIWAGVSYICNGIGLSKSQKDTQIQNVQKDRVLAQGCLKFQAGVFDPNNATVALKLDFVPLWLAKIAITPTIEAETPALADRLEQYQLRAKDVLAAAFMPVSATPDLDALSPQLKCLINIELRQREQAKAIEDTNTRLDSIGEVISLSPNSWRKDSQHLISKIAQKMGGNEFIRDTQAEIFRLVNERAGVSLETRLTNKRRRMADEGVCKSKRDRLNKMDAIADDKKLIEIYVAIVKEMCVKYDVNPSEPEIASTNAPQTYC